MKSPAAYFRWGFSCSYSSNCSRSIPAVPRQPNLPDYYLILAGLSPEVQATVH